MKELLDKILLSDNVVETFYRYYNENEEFKKWLLELIPEVEDARLQKQDNPWHIYDCLDHILHSVKEMNKLSKDLDKRSIRVLAYTMFFHDLGKPKCHIRRYSKFHGREVDSFYNHNKESMVIANRALDELDFTVQEKALIVMLVHEHDIFMFITLENDENKFHEVLNNELLEKYFKKYSSLGDPYKVMKYLLMVGRADNLAQNPSMTKDSLHLLDVMGEMVNKYQRNRK